MSSAQALTAGQTQLGVPYSAEGPWGPGRAWDCSSFTQWCYGQGGVVIPRTSQTQYADTALQRIPIGQQQPGDLAFFEVDADGGQKPQHVGMVWTDASKMIEAPHTGANVQIVTIPNTAGERLMGFGRPAWAPFPPVPPAPPAAAYPSDMLARNTAGEGYWAVRPNGDVYAFDGAPYLGPAPHFLEAWGIPATVGPVVGITDDGAGGYVLECDTGASPGQPALYHIDSSGQYDK